MKERELYKMEIRLSKRAGFCFGVKRAVEKVYEQIETGKTIYTYGPIIHNEFVVNDLAEKGVHVIENMEQLEKIDSGTIIIRSHGVAENVYDYIEKKGLECVDATCPFVKRIHSVVQKQSELGKTIVIVGNAGHPEVEGIMGWCCGDVVVVEKPEEIDNIKISKETEICIVSQTTYNYKKFQDIVEIFGNNGYNSNIVNTICNATEERQTEALAIAAEVDVMIVIGGKHSSNSRKLYEICSEKCAKTYFIQSLDDLQLELPKAVKIVGITAGASTPNKLIEEVQNYVRINF